MILLLAYSRHLQYLTSLFFPWAEHFSAISGALSQCRSQTRCERELEPTKDEHDHDHLCDHTFTVFHESFLLLPVRGS